MAACGSLRPLFEKRAMGENAVLMDPLSSWNQIKPMQPMEQPSFTEIFGELHFKEKPVPHSASLPPLPQPTSAAKFASTVALDRKVVSLDRPRTQGAAPRGEEQGGATESLKGGKLQKQIFVKPPVGFDVGSLSPGTPSADQHDVCLKSPCPIFPAKNSESLHLCTEGLGFESSDDMEDSRSESGLDWSGGGVEEDEEVTNVRQPPSAVPFPKGSADVRTTRSGSTGKFPPPISVIGSSGKPWVYFRAYKGDGRFVLKEVRIPTYEFLQASREDGRLKLHLIQPEDAAEEEEVRMELEGVEAGEEEHHECAVVEQRTAS